jgi:hypothetical protein
MEGFPGVLRPTGQLEIPQIPIVGHSYAAKPAYFNQALSVFGAIIK